MFECSTKLGVVPVEAGPVEEDPSNEVAEVTEDAVVLAGCVGCPEAEHGLIYARFGVQGYRGHAYTVIG